MPFAFNRINSNVVNLANNDILEKKGSKNKYYTIYTLTTIIIVVV